MKLFKKKFIEKNNQKVDPRSQKFVDIIKEMLIDNGIIQPRALSECSLRLLKLTLNFFKNLSPGDEYNVDEVYELDIKFREVLSIYGITNDEQQDAIMIKFFGTLNELGAEGLKE
jgi:hypothetical protein